MFFNLVFLSIYLFIFLSLLKSLKCFVFFSSPGPSTILFLSTLPFWSLFPIPRSLFFLFFFVCFNFQIFSFRMLVFSIFFFFFGSKSKNNKFIYYCYGKVIACLICLWAWRKCVHTHNGHGFNSTKGSDLKKTHKNNINHYFFWKKIKLNTLNSTSITKCISKIKWITWKKNYH